MNDWVPEVYTERFCGFTSYAYNTMTSSVQRLSKAETRFWDQLVYFMSCITRRLWSALVGKAHGVKEETKV